AFSAATTANLSGLADGSYTFEVKARDLALNVDSTPASVTWTVDSTPQITWTDGTGNHRWHTAGNWDLNRVPTTGDDVVIPNLAGTPSVTFDNGTTSVNSLTCSESLNLFGGTLSLAAASSLSGNVAL